MRILSRKFLRIIGILGAIGILIIVGWIVSERFSNQNQPILPVVSPPVSSTDSVKFYTNTEFGFEFQYPEDWTFHANTFYSPFSKFNLVGASPEESGHPDPLTPSMMINIVTPDFSERAAISMQNLESTKSSAIVATIKGTRYTYTFEGRVLIDIIIPLKSTAIIFETDQRYEETFNQIVSTFKFLQ